MLFGNQILSLLRRFIRIAFLQLFGGHKGNVFRQMLNSLRILIPNLMLHMLNDLKDCTYGLFQGFCVSLFSGNYLFPVPLIYIAGVKIIQLLIPADSVHIGIKTLSRLEAILFKSHSLPLGKRLNHLNPFSGKCIHIKSNRTLHTVKVVIQSTGLFYKQGRRDPL